MKFNFHLGSEADFDGWVFDGCEKAYAQLELKFDELKTPQLQNGDFDKADKNDLEVDE